jgi:hypothetical protein
MLLFDAAIAALARTQLGNFTLDQARALGATRHMVRDRVRTGVWFRRHPGVYKLAGAPDTWESRAYAAQLTHELALVSSLAAAHLYGLEDFGPVGIVDVAVPRHSRPRRHPGIRYRESLAFDLANPTVRNGVPVTGPARTVLDVCAAAGRDELMGLAALDEMRRRHFVTWPDLWECLVLHACRGRNGIAMFRRILVKRSNMSVPHGKFPRLVERLFEDAGLPSPVHEFKIGKYYVDFAYPWLKIAIELDGRDPHAFEAAFENDPIRQNYLEVNGWLVLRITWNRFISDPAGVVADVRAAILLRSGVR